MSTRTILRFKQGSKINDVYQHSDGYPSWTIPTLEKFLKWNSFRSDELDYTVANFVTFGKLNHITRFMKRAKKEKSNSLNKEYRQSFEKIFENANANLGILHTGFGIEDHVLSEKEIIESSCEYFYEIELPINEIETNIETIIPINVYEILDDHLKKIGSVKFSTKQSKIIEYSKGLLKEIEN